MRITKKKFQEFSRRCKQKIADATEAKKLVIYHKAIDRASVLFNKHHNPNFDLTKYKPINFGQVLRLNKKWKSNEEVRRYVIQSHRTFFCPISNQMLDMNRSFFLRDVILDFAAFDTLRKEYFKEVEL